jgi:hypothetical protein
LTPPCYHLEPPATAAPFYFPGQIAAFPHLALAGGNYVGNLPLSLLDSIR